MQAKVEPGDFDTIEIAPTLQYTQVNYSSSGMPWFYELSINARPEQIKYSHLQSEEGGRFYHDQNCYQIIEIPENDELDIPENYIWMTIKQIKSLIKFNNIINIEARGLLSCLNYRSLD
jgi:oxidase EvaA